MCLNLSTVMHRSESVPMQTILSKWKGDVLLQRVARGILSCTLCTLQNSLWKYQFPAQCSTRSLDPTSPLSGASFIALWSFTIDVDQERLPALVAAYMGH